MDDGKPFVKQAPDSATSSPTAPSSKSADESADVRLSRWQLGLFLASSAALSGIAVVLWNRRALQHLREQSLRPKAPATAAEIASLAQREEFV